MDLDLQGNVKRFTLPEILQLIAAGRKSGTLGIQRDESIVMVYFKDGDIVYGYGPRQTFHLGQLLKERGVISDDQLKQAISQQAKSDNTKRLGDIMIAADFIDRNDLQKVVTLQIKELLYSLLSWQNGSFKFYENQFPTDEEITVCISVENVILEGLRRSDEMNLVRETLPNSDTVYTISASQADRRRDVSLKATEWNVMALVDGYRSLKEICEASQADEVETMTHLAQLKMAGIITPAGIKKKPAGQPQKLDTMIDRLAGLFEAYLSEKSAVVSRNDRGIIRTKVESAD